MTARGKFIVIEGIDGSGKTTQAKRLFERVMRELTVKEEPNAPSGTVPDHPAAVLTSQPWKVGRIGSLIYNAILKIAPPFGPEGMALLFAADRLDHVESIIEPALKRGAHVICDRYLPSSLTYQAETLSDSLIDDGPQVWIETLNTFALEPNLTIIIDTPEEVAFARRAARGGAEELYESREFQSRVAIRYALLGGGNIVHIADGTEDEVADTIWRLFELITEEQAGIKQ